jgi:hypothetical protein
MAIRKAVFASVAVLGLWACSSQNNSGWGDFGDGGGGAQTDGASAGTTCSTCTTDGDCGGGRCVRLGGGTYCAATCGGGGSCSSGDTCVSVETSGGANVQACVPPGECSGSSTNDGGGPGNGSSGGKDGSAPYDSGSTQPVGSVGANGGTLSRLLFAVVGDTRPATYDDVGGYPTAVITKIFQDIQAQTPAIPFIVSTGDYQFSSTGQYSTAAQQLSIYTKARSTYAGVQYTAMGNHECTGADASNCGPNGKDGITSNYTAYMNALLAPIQKTLPYYVININATDGSWTSKFVFVAANAWDSTQSSWLQSTMAQKTTYTFVVRHEPSNSSGGAPGVSPSDSIVNQFPYTMMITGHSHTWDGFGYYTAKQIIVGNGGAPLTNTSKNYGFAVISQQSDGTIMGDMLDYDSLQPSSKFHFVVTADGTLK